MRDTRPLFLKRIMLIVAMIGGLCVFYNCYRTAKNKDMSFRIVSNAGGYKWISAEGRITITTPGEFEKFLSEVKSTDDKSSDMTIYFNSQGGNIWAAMDLGNLIREHRLSTAIGSTRFDQKHDEYTFGRGLCISACLIAFLGGESRYQGASVLGFKKDFYNERFSVHHYGDKKFREMEHEEQQRILFSSLVTYISRMGVDPRLLSFALVDSMKEIKFIDAKLSEQLNVVWDSNKIRVSKFGRLIVKTCEDCEEYGLFNQVLFLEGIQIPGIEPAGISIIEKFEFPDSDVFLISLSLVPSCPSLYQFIHIDRNGIQASEEFGTCSDLVEASREGETIRVTLPHFERGGDPNKSSAEDYIEGPDHHYVYFNRTVKEL